MKNKKFLASLFLAIFSVFVLISCKTKMYNVNFEVNGGSFVQSQQTEDGTLVEPADPTRDGYKFVGWYEDSEFTDPFDFATEKVDGDTTLYAKWEKIENSVTVAFDTNGGSKLDNVVIDEGTTLTKPNDPTKEGYKFGGWYSDESLTTKFDFATKIESNLTLYAKWDVYTIAEIIELCQEYVDEPSTEKYAIEGKIETISNESYGNMTVSDSTGSITIYGSYSEDGSVRYDGLDNKPVVGDVVEFFGVIQNYGGSKPELIDAWMIGYSNEQGTDVDVPEDPIDSSVDKAELKTIAELIELAGDYPNEASTERFYVQAVVDSIDNPQYGQMTISDGTGTISVYGTYSADGELRYSELDEKPVAGDIVLLYGTIHEFKGSAEISSGWIIAFEKSTPSFDINDYEEMSIADARNEEVNTKVILEGVVAAYTYNAAQNPIGFILIDDTSSIYVYDSQIAPQVEIGNKIKIAASRENWILEDEQTNAAKYGYDGCIQVASVYLLENDKNTDNVWNKDWVLDSTVKNMMDNDVSQQNNTSLIYKVNALVKEVAGSGFTNFYFFDIDGVTGSYAYSQANGKDFTWLREFDGKICTVYLMVLNYKSEASGLTPRLLPVEVIDENYKFDLKDAPQMVLDYYVADNFKVNTYYANPNLELPTSVSNELLGFENVKIEYSSNNPAITFVNNKETNKTYMNIVDLSVSTEVIITVKSTYEEYTASGEYHINIGNLDSFASVTVAEAINADLETEVTVRAIVGPSLVNRDGFYLMDETGMIAITTDTETLGSLNLGDEVIIKGTRTQFGTDTAASKPGQSVLLDCEVLVNLYGDNPIPTNNFIEGKSIKDLYELDYTEDHTTEVYLVRAKIEVTETPFYTSMKILDPVNLNEEGQNYTINLYSSSANQYSWLFDFAGEEVTLAIAPCNWNKKPRYAGCALFVQTDDGHIVYNTLNFN